MSLNFLSETQPDGGAARAPATPMPPEALAPYFPQLEILECLGRGGMGVVYKARQKSLNRLVALKLLAPERVRDPQFAERFAREARALAALNHPNIVTVHDFGQAGGFYFLLMEFVDGANLRQLLHMRKFSPEEALAIVPPLCEALQYAHERGIIHRDIKPENLLLDKEGRIKIADFGIVRMLGNADGTTDATAASPDFTRLAGGTPGYMAPEQKTGPRPVDSRADIYSLGVVFYEMLTGELPGRPIEPPSRKVLIDVRLDAIVLRALEQTPERRYQHASDLKTMVETIATTPLPRNENVVGSATGAPATDKSGRRRNRGSDVLFYGRLGLSDLLRTTGSQRLQYVLLFSGTLGLSVGGMLLAMALVCWLVNASFRVTFQPSELFLTLALTAACGGMRLAALKLDAGKAGRNASVPSIKAKITLWKIIGLCMVAVMAAGMALFVGNLLPRIHARLDAFPVSSGTARVAAWIVLSVAAVVFLIVRQKWRVANKPTDDSSAAVSSAPVAAAVAPAADKLRQPPTGGWGWFIGKLFGITSPMALKVANLSALGFLCFLGFMPLPGWKHCFGFSGFFGLIGVANILELISRNKKDRQQPLCFSRAAIVGACWASLFFVAFVGCFWAKTSVSTREYHGGPTWWQQMLVFTLMLLGALAPFGTTILGCVALTQIRRSAGKIYGFGLALFDALLFPLLALNGLIAWLLWTWTKLYLDFFVNVENLANPNWQNWRKPFQAMLLAHQSGVVFVLTLVIGGLLSVLLVRRAWRAVNRPIGVTSVNAPASVTSSRTGCLISALVASGLALGLLAIIFVLLNPTHPPSMRQRFLPHAGMAEKTSWSILDKPSEFNPNGWAVMAHMSLGGTIMVRLPGATQDVCRITLAGGNDDQINLDVEDLQRNTVMHVALTRDASTEIVVNGTSYGMKYPAVTVAAKEPDTTPFALVIMTHTDASATNMAATATQPTNGKTRTASRSTDDTARTTE